MTIITSKYRSDTARLFVDDITFNDYYLFVSSTSNTSVENTNESKRSFLEKTLFGKRIDPNEVFFMIKNYAWAINLVYEQYDDKTDLFNKRYYAVVYPENNETGDYRIYKCLFNNYGEKSINPPNYNANTPNQIYVMPDGYVWKFMYSISELEFTKYNTRGYIPIEPNSTGDTPIVSNSSIDQIFVENLTNRGYEKVVGSIHQIVGDNVIISSTPGSFNAIENYYVGYALYVTNTNNESKIYQIDTYTYNSITGRATITLVEGVPIDGVLLEASTYMMLPRIEIRGDGAGATAIPVISSEGVITKIQVINGGSGYTNARAFVPDPYAFDPMTINSLDERVILRPILSPAGGHSSNIIDELSCRNVLTYISLTETDNVTIPTTNEFASIGIVKNPEFKIFPYPDIFDNRIEIALDAHNLQVNETIVQIETDQNSEFFNEVRFSGKVHSISNNFIYVCEYMGPYPNDVDDSAMLYANNDFSDISLRIDLPLLSSQNQVLVINTDNSPAYPEEYGVGYPGFNISKYRQRSGDVYYMNSFFSITRTEESREQFKILLEF